MTGPLSGLKVVEFAGIAPAPFACMLLADLGADVVRIDRAVAGEDGAVPASPSGPTDVLGRGRRTLALDLKSASARALATGMVAESDVLVEGFRPGVMERLGLGPDHCLVANPALVYGRMTGWGQDGPLSRTAGHDINYLAVSGALSLIGREGDRPVPPANLLGDFAGGGLLLAFGVLAALHERQHSGLGQVVDAAMTDGSALLTTFIHGLIASDAWTERTGTNTLDGGSAFYDTYETADGGHIAVGAIEPEFFEQLTDRLDLSIDASTRDDPAANASTRAALAARFRERTRDEWADALQTTDACVSPVLSLTEVADHPHHKARSSFVEVGGVVQPAPAPRFSRTPATTPSPPAPHGGEGVAALADWRVSKALIDDAVAAGSLVEPDMTCT